MGEFQQKEGLFEYSIKRLAPDAQQEALHRIEAAVPLTDESLKRFLNIGTDDGHGALIGTRHEPV
jgi:hypothetical protein